MSAQISPELKSGTNSGREQIRGFPLSHLKCMKEPFLGGWTGFNVQDPCSIAKGKIGWGRKVVWAKGGGGDCHLTIYDPPPVVLKYKKILFNFFNIKNF